MKFIQCVGYIIGYFLGIGVSMFAICGIVKLITIIFGLAFSWILAVCIWALIFIVSHIVALNNKMHEEDNNKNE